VTARGPAAAPPTPKGRATRERLLQAARAELAERGTIEVATVAARAGVAQSVLYRYFAAKDGLVAAVVDDFYDEYSREVFDAPLRPGAAWMDREAERLEREVRFIYAHPLGRAVATGLVHEAAATRADAARQREQVAAAARNIRHGQRTGELPRGVDAGLAAAAIIGALRAMLAEALGRDRPPPPGRVSAAALRLGAELLRAPGGSAQEQ
jgi:AcrR family transcriptional regulator